MFYFPSDSQDLDDESLSVAQPPEHSASSVGVSTSSSAAFASAKPLPFSSRIDNGPENDEDHVDLRFDKCFFILSKSCCFSDSAIEDLRVPVQQSAGLALPRFVFT